MYLDVIFSMQQHICRVCYVLAPICQSVRSSHGAFMHALVSHVYLCVS